VFAFIPGHWLFLSAVCSEWRAIYANIGEQQAHSIGLYEPNKFVIYDSKTTLYSAAVASPETARLARSHGCGLQIHTMAQGCGWEAYTNYRLKVIAGLHADVQTLTALHDLGMQLDDTVLDAVALSGRLHILQYLINEQLCDPVSDGVNFFAALGGNIHILEWLKTENLSRFCWFTCSGAVEGDQLAVVQYLRNQGCKWDESVIMCDAAGSDSITIVKWLQQHEGVEVDARTMAAAASKGQTAMCEYLLNIGCYWTDTAPTRAAEAGHFETLRWLRENGCPWDVRAVLSTQCTMAM
jgi:hypothetical protein